MLEINKIKVTSDVIKALFHYIGHGDDKRFPADVPKIQKTFYNLSITPSISEVFKGFIFDKSKSYPRSKTVSFALDRLQLSDLLACRNPELDQFEISKSLAEDTKIEGLFTSKENKLLKKGAEMFFEQVRA